MSHHFIWVSCYFPPLYSSIPLFLSFLLFLSICCLYTVMIWLYMSVLLSILIFFFLSLHFSGTCFAYCIGSWCFLPYLYSYSCHIVFWHCCIHYLLMMCPRFMYLTCPLSLSSLCIYFGVPPMHWFLRWFMVFFDFAYVYWYSCHYALTSLHLLFVVCVSSIHVFYLSSVLVLALHSFWCAFLASIFHLITLVFLHHIWSFPPFIHVPFLSFLFSFSDHTVGFFTARLVMLMQQQALLTPYLQMEMHQ